MPRRRKENQSVELEAAATFEGWDELDEASKRRIRNRLSQRHFRERKSMYIKNLEKASKASSQSESARNKALARESADLRAAMLKMRAQILKLACSLHSVAAEAGKILNVNGPVDPESPRAEDGPGMSPSSNLAYDVFSSGDFDEAGVTDQEAVVEGQDVSSNEAPGLDASGVAAAFQPEAATEDVHPLQSIGHDSGGVSNPEGHAVSHGWDGQNANLIYPDLFGSNSSSAMFLLTQPQPEGQSPCDQVPTFNHYQTSSNSQISLSNAPTKDAQVDDQAVLRQREHRLEAVHSLFHSVPAKTNLSLPNGHFPPSFDPDIDQTKPSSAFATHMEALELQVRCQLDAAPDKTTRDMLIRSCSTIMSLFVQNAWPSSYSVWFKSQVPQIIGPILLWRISPSYETYNLLGENYKPTELQLSVSHSTVIDWIPYAELRDKVILYYNNSVVLDRLLCDMMNSYVIEVPDLSQVIPRAPRGRAYFGIWNIFRAIDLAFENQSNDLPTSSLPTSAGFADNSANDAANDVENPFGIYNEFTLSEQSSSPGSTGQAQREEMFPNSGAVHSNKEFNLIHILTTPASVLKLSHDIRLYASRSWRIDRALFDKYPELKFSGYEKVVAQGRSCRIPTAPPDAPKELTADTMQMYQRALAVSA